jgi:dTDP-4-amino-4,6-dideoxygalactose transaminase
VSELALLGGEPAFEAPLHVGRPNVGDRARLLERIAGAIDSRWLTNDGPLVREFERTVAATLDVPYCVAMCNGTVALEIAIRAAGLEGEVIVSPFTFVATAYALQWQRITPVFCDIDPRTHNIDPERVEELITPRTTGILAVHLWGRPAPVDALEEIAARHGLRLLFDAAHAFGCSHGGRMIGGFGAAEVLSFHATKVVNSFEGGAIVTADGELAEVARLMRNHGFADYDDVAHVGTNGKLSEVAAAMGLTSLESMADFVAANRRNHEAYRAGLAGVEGIELLAYDEGESCN